MKAVKDRIAALDGTVPTAWPNKKLTPPNGLWLSVHYVPSKPFAVGMGEGGEERLDGFVQIDVNVPTDSGEKAQDDVLKALELWFTPGRSMTHNSQTAKVTAAQRSQGRLTEIYWRISLSIYFYATYPRNTLT